MATPLLQKTRQRKMIYFGAIVVLFTLSLIHREVVVKELAKSLQLTEQSQGEVELTSSAVRLSLVGSRGLVVTMLWYTAMDRQKRHEWNELDLLIQSITKLQPHFITPWLYQSWNISFNVAVECDRPRDKYYYISRGLELLAQGERRNGGYGDESRVGDPNVLVFPGNPEMRHSMGFFYQLKIGNSDERLTMRSLLEMSCIDPIERNPERFWIKDERGRRDVNLVEFRKFCDNYPRLVRRLREQLGYSEPRRIVQFLEDHQNIPSRFQPIDPTKAGQQKESAWKKNRLDQFPILPPHEGTWPNWDSYDLKLPRDEEIDVFLVCRTWYEFAQKPLPPPQHEHPRPLFDYDKLHYRAPKHMVAQLFRGYPSRAQVYIAETLESEGFFDKDGWEIQDWFTKMPGRQGSDDIDRVGTEAKYHSRLAWEKSYRRYKEHGEVNGFVFTPTHTAKLTAEAALWRNRFGMKVDPQMRPDKSELGRSLEAHMDLYYSAYFRKLANYDTFLYQSEGERDPLTVTARKVLFAAERERKGRRHVELMLRHYDRAWALYIQACLKHPKFAQVQSMQEDLYEIHQRYLKESQEVHREAFKKRAVAAAKIGFSPYMLEVGEPTLNQIETFSTALLSWPHVDWRAELVGRVLAKELIPDNVALLSAKLAQWPYPNWRETMCRYLVVTSKEKEAQQMNRVVPIPQRTGPLDTVWYYDAPNAHELKQALLAWTLGTAAAPQNLTAATVLAFPDHEYFLLSTTEAPTTGEARRHWQPLIQESTRNLTIGRRGALDSLTLAGRASDGVLWHQFHPSLARPANRRA